MAIAKSDPRQPYLENLDLPNARRLVEDYRLPALEAIDLEEIEFIVDVDLDDLIVLFGDKNQPHYIDEASDSHSILVNAESDNVIGVILHRFLSESVKLHPDLVPVLRYATIIAGNSIESSDIEAISAESGRQSVRARLQGWMSARIRREEQKELFNSFAHLIGIT